MTQPVLNLNSPLAEVKTDTRGRLVAYLISPWNSFFQQFVQPAPAVATIELTGSPFKFTPNVNGNLIISGGVVSNISLMRGTDTIDLTGEKIIPTAINDSVSITYSNAPSVKFLGA